MKKSFCFNDLRKFVSKENNTEILDFVDKVADAAFIFAPVVLGPEFLPLINILDVKDRIINLGKNVIQYIVNKQEPDYLGRIEQLRMAYSLICYTAFFDTLDRLLPSNIQKEIRNILEKESSLSNDINEKKAKKITNYNLSIDLPYTDYITPFSETAEELLDLYKISAQKIYEGIAKTINKKSTKNELKELLCDELPKQAVECYKAQFFNLVSEFNDFSIFALGVELDSLHHISNEQKEILYMINDSTENIDVGLKKLSNVADLIYTNNNRIHSQEIVDDLKKVYCADIEKPIIDDKEITSEDEEVKLIFPKIVDAFIPQSYKYFLYTDNIKIEDESVWKKLKKHKDLNRFFLKYLTSANSIDYPLIILGHPGSGKSLLTKVLSAQLMSDLYTVIRIPLREVNADSTIDLLVEQQIKKVTSFNLPQGGYATFAKQFTDKPLLIILDGYDELLQAKGDVFSSYLDKVMRFQQNQKDLSRPVRIIVTSRITLIDKAYIPVNSTVLRLLEFDENQRDEWIDIWNKTNENYFLSQHPQILPFSLPKEKNNEKNSILELAEQPLLLLMLALYDSEDNSLANYTGEMNRTALYDNLLRRFVRRERSRFPNFRQMSTDEQNKTVEMEMRRLGVVAIGMFNRKKLVIHTKELDNDLKLFNSQRNNDMLTKGNLKDSESLLGGFFFIHQSLAHDISADSDKTDSAFEFLHNTFGEFLTADIILRFSLQECVAINFYRKNDALSSELKNKLYSPDGLCKEWFMCLMFTPLFSRPVVLDMIREHMAKSLDYYNISQQDFLESFIIVVKNQLKMLLNTHTPPKAMMEQYPTADEISLLGFISIYTLNLVILASVLCPNGFVFDEDEYGKFNTLSETSPWNKLSFLWKSWFSSETLTGVSTIFNAYRSENKIEIRSHKKFEAVSIKKPIDMQLSVSYSLGDVLNTGVNGLQSDRFSQIVNMNRHQIANLLYKESKSMFLCYVIKCIKNDLLECNDRKNVYDDINYWIKRITENVGFTEINLENIISFLQLVEILILYNVLYIETRMILVKYFLHTFSDKFNPNFELSQKFEDIIYKLIANNNNYSRDKIRESLLFSHSHNLYGLNHVYRNNKKHYMNMLLHDRIYFEPLKRSNNEILNYTQYYADKHIQFDFGKSIKTNPVWVTETLLDMPYSKTNKKEFLHNVENILLEMGKGQLEFIDSKALINIILLTQKVNDEEMTRLVREEIRNNLIDFSEETMCNLLVNSPALFSSLLDLFPQTVDFLAYLDNKRGYFEPSYITERLLNNCKELTFSKDSMLAFVEIGSKLYKTKNRNVRFDIVELVCPYDNIKNSFKNKLGQLNISELNCLYQYAKLKKDKELCKKIEESFLKLKN